MTPRRFMPALLLLFVGSGCAALIYEIVWFQLLQLVIGSSAVSLGVLLGTFMGGMCLGSLLLPRYVSDRQHPLRVYAWLEIGHRRHRRCWCCSAMPLVVRHLHRVGRHRRGQHPAARRRRRHLPAAADDADGRDAAGGRRAGCETTPDGVSWLGFFYGGNTGGAVHRQPARRLLSAARSRHGDRDLRGCGAELRWSRRSRCWWRGPCPTNRPGRSRAGGTFAAARRRVGRLSSTIALSGLTALSAEVIWTRMLSLLIGATVYTFSLILAVFLLGIGIGSSIGSAMARGLAAAAHRARLVPDAAVRSHLLGRLHVHRSRCRGGRSTRRSRPAPGSTSSSIWCGRCGPSCRPRSCGAPASRSRSPRSPREGQDPARLVGGVYAANTVGAIIGATGRPACCSSAGSAASAREQLLIIIAGLSALLVLEAAPSADDWRPPQRRLPAPCRSSSPRCARRCWRATCRPIPPLLVAYGRYAVTRIGQADIIYWGEGWNASVAVSRLPGGVLNYHNAGKVQASSEPQDMRLQRMLGHMTTLIPKNPQARAGHRLRRRRHRRSGVDRSDGRVADHRRDRAARAAGRLDLLRRAQLQRRQEPEDDRAPR